MPVGSAVVIGGGVIGAAVAYHLAARGVRDVLVLDRGGEAGSGSTGRATGGFRVQFASAMLVALSLLSRAKLQRFTDETGGDCGYVPAGYLWIAETAAELDTLRAALAAQRAAGVNDAVEVDAARAAELNPALRRAPIAGATYCANDGFIRPLQILEGYRRAAERRGARFVWDSDVVGFEGARDGRLLAVRTAGERFATEAVVVAAGAWSARVAALAGITIPVTPLRRQVAVTVPTSVLPATMPMTLYAGDGFHLRVRDRRVLLLLPSAGGVDPFDDTVDERWLDDVVRIARARVPVLERAALDRSACWAGLYEMTPDAHPILDRAPGVANCYLVTGASGHGVMHAPALGQLAAELICEGAITTLDASALRADRFGRSAAANELL